MAAHTHRFGTISHVIAPDNPHVLRACQVGLCSETEVVCVLCEVRGDRRAHKGHMHATKPEVLDAIEDLKLKSYFGNLALDAELRAERTKAQNPRPRR